MAVASVGRVVSGGRVGVGVSWGMGGSVRERRGAGERERERERIVGEANGQVG